MLLSYSKATGPNSRAGAKHCGTYRQCVTIIEVACRKGTEIANCGISFDAMWCPQLLPERKLPISAYINGRQGSFESKYSQCSTHLS